MRLISEDWEETWKMMSQRVSRWALEAKLFNDAEFYIVEVK